VGVPLVPCGGGLFGNNKLFAFVKKVIILNV
jgi:hypothetical protein